MARARKWLQPSHGVYLLGHLVLIATGVAVFTHGSVITIAVGTSLFATGVAGVVVFCYVLVTSIAAQRLAVLTEFGFVDAFDARGVAIKPEYERRVNRARQHIDIMGFGLRTLREDYATQFVQWRQRAEIRILLLDPEVPSADHSYASQRDREEGNDAGTIEADVRKFVSTTRELVGGEPGHSLKIRLYTCLPSVNVFRVDNELFWGPYLIREQSRNTPTFVFRRGGVIFERIMDHFEQIWADDRLSRPIPGAWLTE